MANQSSVLPTQRQEGVNFTVTPSQVSGMQVTANQYVPKVLDLQTAEISLEFVKQTESGERFTVMDPDCIVPSAQRDWATRTFSEVVFLHTPGGDIALSAFCDSGDDILLISKQFLDPTLILNNLRCPVKTYGSKETEQKYVCLLYTSPSPRD